MAVTQAHIDALNIAIADGVRQVVLPGGQVTTYNTTASLIQARDDLRRELARQQATGAIRQPVRRVYLHQTTRGYNDGYDPNGRAF